MRLYRTNCDQEDAAAARRAAGSTFNNRYQTRLGRKRAKVMAKDIDIARQHRLYSGLPTRYWHHNGIGLQEPDPFSE
jgi:hypothetical protein